MALEMQLNHWRVSHGGKQGGDPNCQGCRELAQKLEEAVA